MGAKDDKEELDNAFMAVKRMIEDELKCILNCGGNDCNGECDYWNEIKSAIILLKKDLDITIYVDNLLESLDVDNRLIKHAQNVCSRDFLSTIQDGKRDSASGMGYVDILSGNEFELLITRLYTAMRYSVKQTARTRDGGVDIIAEKDNKCFQIQCKRYAQQRKVSIGIVRELYGVISALSTMDKGIIISSTAFTKPAKDFAAKSGIQLFNRSDLERMLKKYLPDELPGFRIVPGIQCVSKEKIEVALTLINTSNRPMICLQVYLRLYNEDNKKISEVFPQKGTDRLGEGDVSEYRFAYISNPEINYYRISIRFKRNEKSQLISSFQGSKHF